MGAHDSGRDEGRLADVVTQQYTERVGPCIARPHEVSQRDTVRDVNRVNGPRARQALPGPYPGGHGLADAHSAREFHVADHKARIA